LVRAPEDAIGADGGTDRRLSEFAKPLRLIG